jgi:hypothetical protein
MDEPGKLRMFVRAEILALCMVYFVTVREKIFRQIAFVTKSIFSAVYTIRAWPFPLNLAFSRGEKEFIRTGYPVGR